VTFGERSKDAAFVGETGEYAARFGIRVVANLRKSAKAAAADERGRPR
jgi:hypothetical protein